ncbi:cytosolic factor, phosphatidylinositol/phosphatidylcholine transfer protein [Marasmius crinis-equi]|uniref:Cytosolic factor, phosphatidylinositol/phosphatidylcholine transfer protein n=1 Tax=Marasmius crinis-equi TaxID=585013 RepID=A0ABR3F4T9_9AGAR
MSQLSAASASPMPAGVTNPDYKPLPGRLGNLTVVQLHALDKLKKELKDEGHFVEERMDDATLLRFLRARKFDVALAKAMLLDCEKWRKEFGVDDITKNFDFKEKAEVDKYYPQYYHKMDKDGRPIYIERLGKLDIKALYAITTQERQLQRLVYEYEKFLSSRLPACSASVGYPVETSCTILDLHNVSLSNFYRVKDYVSQASSIGQNRYPECMGKFYIINAPYLFSTVWTLIKPWLDEVTVAKINILGSNYKAELLKQIPAENLPKDFGGECECAGGCSMSDAGPWNTPEWREKEEKIMRGEKAEKKEGAPVPNGGAENPAPAA